MSGRDTAGAIDVRAVSDVVLDTDDSPVPSAGGSEEPREHAVVRTERLPVKPMFVDEAVLQLEMSHRQFLVFLNARSARVNVLYRRKSGDFGLIEPTAN